MKKESGFFLREEIDIDAEWETEAIDYGDFRWTCWLEANLETQEEKREIYHIYLQINNKMGPHVP